MSAADKHDPGADETTHQGSTGPDAPVAVPVDPENSFVYDPLARDPDAVAREEKAASDAAAASTIGTGTSIALGCVAGTVLLIVVAIIILFAVSAISK
ncbi:MAG: hypothetical protein QM753_05385 [Thermomicrobiales bacterium]